MTNNFFFYETTEQSKAKAAIVSKYFWAWAKVVIPTTKHFANRIAYIDLFAGPGRYKDGTHSTPLLVLERATQDADMREMLVTLFNDAKRVTVMTLYETHNVGRPYILKNYKDVLKQLEADGKITVDPPATKRRKIRGELTMADHVTVSFSRRSNLRG